MSQIIEHLLPISFTVVAEPSNHSCDFKVYKHVSSSPEMLYSLPDPMSCEFTTDLAKAEIYMHGYIKWDGCSNWHFDIQEGCMIHFCSVEEGEAIGTLFKSLYAIAARVIPCWDGLKD